MALELNGTTGVSLVQDGVVATADLADNAVTSAKLFSGFANGVSEFDLYYLDTDVTTNNTDLSSWTRIHKSGTGITNSSAEFTFPSTGLYLVSWHCAFISGGNDGSIMVYGSLSTNGGSSYADYGYCRTGQVDQISCHASTQQPINVTNTSNFKFKLYTSSFAAGTYVIGGAVKDTIISFIRIGDSV